MEVVTKKSLIASAAERFREAHQSRGRWLVAENQPSPEAIYQALRALPADATEAQIVAIAGDDRWTANICDECGNDRDITVVLGAEIHHPIDALNVCLTCLDQAARLAHQG
jgi:hypothetical protein